MKENIRNAVVFAVCALMIGAANLLDTPEIIFPEIGAMSVGLLIMDKKVWHIGKVQAVLLLLLEALTGVFICRHIGFLPLYFTLPLSLLAASLYLLLSGTTMLPAIAACLMPVVLGISSWHYVYGVGCLALLVAGCQTILEHTGLRSHRTPLIVARRPITQADVYRWLVQAVCVLPIAAAGALSGWPFMAAPPLIVTFIEFSNSQSGFRHRPWQIILILIIAAAIPSMLLIGGTSVGFSATGIGIASVALTLCVFNIFRKYFAPALAVTILAMHVPADMLWNYPLQIAIGSAYAIVISTVPYLMFKKE